MKQTFGKSGHVFLSRRDKIFDPLSMNVHVWEKDDSYIENYDRDEGGVFMERVYTPEIEEWIEAPGATEV